MKKVLNYFFGGLWIFCFMLMGAENGTFISILYCFLGLIVITMILLAINGMLNDFFDELFEEDKKCK